MRQLMLIGGDCIVITPEMPCSRTGSSYVVSGTTTGFLASQTTEDTGCGLTETPWIIQVSSVLKENYSKTCRHTPATYLITP